MFDASGMKRGIDDAMKSLGYLTGSNN